jgi:putative thioredoxin
MRALVVQELTMLDFTRDIIEASRQRPVLVDFHAHWCGPCRMLGPVLENAVAQADGGLSLVTIDTDRNQDLAVAAGVSGIPDVRLYKDGVQIGGFTGFRPLPQVRQWIHDRLSLAKV